MPSRYLTNQEALTFVTEKLHLRLSNFERPAPSLPLLQKICTAFAAEVPYASIRHLDVPVDRLNRRQLPTLEQVKDTGMNLKGGMCYEMNVFLHWLLAGLDFQVEFLLGKAYGSRVNCHLLNYVDIDGRRYLVDGGSYPMILERLICLDFEGEVSPVTLQSIWEVRVRRTVVDGEAGYVEQFRWTENAAIANWKIPTDPDGWADINEFILVPRTLEEVYEPMKRSYTDATISPIVNRVFCYRYPEGRLLQIRNTVLHTEAAERVHLIGKRAQSQQSLVRLIVEHFGQYLPEDVVARAVSNFEVLCPHAFSSTFD
ncbi:hypothetical protein BV898_10515 [Hypsibius exemplaris]|uniref:arylamine N-acetyltransferase n=1 Tax=Hypsibius exemplaris TaxID=2072580 RepID=A0A1W0WJI3_HYPEX|nr:hypothetical protein BV898_10515 [Hypsibius exemplaris]